MGETNLERHYWPEKCKEKKEKKFVGKPNKKRPIQIPSGECKIILR
jgi:hypothetical protein